MIPKIICWILGHKLHYYKDAYENGLLLRTKVWADKCSRCGELLKQGNEE